MFRHQCESMRHVAYSSRPLFSSPEFHLPLYFAHFGERLRLLHRYQDRSRAVPSPRPHPARSSPFVLPIGHRSAQTVPDLMVHRCPGAFNWPWAWIQHGGLVHVPMRIRTYLHACARDSRHGGFLGNTRQLQISDLPISMVPCQPDSGAHKPATARACRASRKHACSPKDGH